MISKDYHNLMNSLQQKIEQVLRDKILDIADEYKGVKREEHVQVYLGNPSQLVKDLLQLFEEEMMREKIKMVDKIKKEMYEMQAAKKIEFVDGEKREVLEVLTKYQVASLLNCYPHTYFDGTTPLDEIELEEKNKKQS